MSITSPDDRISTYNPVVPTTVFPATFPVFDNDDIKVFVDGQERDDFAVTATYAEGVATDAKAVFAIGVTGKVEVVGARQPHRTNAFGNGPLPTRDFNLALDTLESEMQEAHRDISRAVKVPYGTDPIQIVPGTPGQVVAYGPDGTLIGATPAPGLGNMMTEVYDPAGKNAVIFDRLPVMPEAFGAQYDGSDDKEAIEDAAAFAVAQKRPLFLSPGRTYTFSSLVLPDGLAVMGSGAIRHDGTTVAGDVVSVGLNSLIETLKYSTPSHGNGVYDVRVGNGSRIGYLETLADSQAQGETVTTEGNDVWIGFHRAENMDRPLHVDNTLGAAVTEGFGLGGYEYKSYMRGIKLSATRFYNIGNGVMHTRSPNALNEAPGYNAILLSSAPDGVIAGGVWEDSAEHCFRIGGNTGPGAVNTVRVNVGPLVIRKCSASAIKINPNYTGRAKAISFASVLGIDVGFTTGATAKRSDGLRLSHCQDIVFGSVAFVADELATSAEVALRLNNAKNIVIEHLDARFVESGLMAIDETADVDSGQGATQSGPVKSVHIKSLVGAKGAGTYPFSFALPNHDMGDIRIHGMDITGLTTGLAAFDATTTLTDILEFQGRVVTSSTAAVSNPPASDNFRFDLRINGARYFGPYRKVTANTSTETIGADPFDPGASPTQLGSMFLQSQTGTAGQGNWGSGLVYSRAGASGRRGVATASKQTGASAHQMGLSVLVNGGTASSEALAEALQVTHEKALAIPDGITAPATIPGWAQIYVDATTGDLMVKFGDGVTKPIASDT